MELRQLRTFKAVAELGSLSKASDRLRVAQPALSRQIKLLEHELRSELFVRTGRGMTLTAAGQMLLDRIGGLVRQIEQVRDDIQSIGGSPSGRVVLGLVPTVSTVLSSRFAQEVVKTLPDISLCIVESYGGHLVEWLHRGEMDLAVIYGSADNLHLTTQKVGRDEIVMVGPAGSGLNQAGTVDLAWVADQKLVLPSHSHGLRVLIEKAMVDTVKSLKVLVEADSYRVLVDLVESGLAYSLLPPSAVHAELAAGRLESAKIADAAIVRELVIASPTGRSPSIASATIAERLVTEIAKLTAEGLWELDSTS